jgi:integrase
VDESRGKVSFAEWAEHYFATASRRLARTTLAPDEMLLRVYVLPRWGQVPIGRITKTAVERWVAELGDANRGVRGGDLTPGTVEKIYHVFRKVIRAAYEDDRIPRLPCPTNPPIGRGKRKAVRFLTEGEVEALAAAMAPSFKVVIHVASYGGFRIGELFALRLDDVDWLRGTIRVDENLTDVNGHLDFGHPKTERAFRTVPMAEPVMGMLRHQVETASLQAPQDLLFRGRDGGILRPNGWRRRHFDPAVRQAGLAPLTPHDLRHTAASFFIAEGANQWMLAEILGHRDTRMIDRVYGHLFEKDRQALRDRMSQRATQAALDNVIQLSR